MWLESPNFYLTSIPTCLRGGFPSFSFLRDQHCDVVIRFDFCLFTQMDSYSQPIVRRFIHSLNVGMGLNSRARRTHGCEYLLDELHSFEAACSESDAAPSSSSLSSSHSVHTFSKTVAIPMRHIKATTQIKASTISVKYDCIKIGRPKYQRASLQSKLAV